MLIFGIDTCCMAATAALMDEHKLVAQTVVNHNRTHSQKMMPQIETMFQQAEKEVDEVDLFAAAVGPGSFTGVRIGVATVKALAQAVGKPCVAVSTLEALAFNSTVFDGVICPILDARRNQVYNGLFQGGRELVRLCEDRALGIDQLLEELKHTEEKILFCGDGVPAFRDVIEETLGDQCVFASRMQNLNLAGAVAELALLGHGEQVSCGELVPQYVRLSQAERERMEGKF
ncbi:MAG: tRNA (adenosine(37)-N6)-threonylcarbamoyltransferase complex dimerization subunit type 1 TsaB [Clostridia bacterium]|nr:tRNA (adenosine(37)-N6)-threonylcarbamoyltransferase complex dimerization subunit type 1 TsaB [Clostridia bacterium]